ncbi:hypothetical protein FQN50_003694 [Emmonsiellopsis sp. PD_5]|nr:hypothetical protein FQN50_003694 [Emmonsiellopsis sp. PD_5]
MASTRRSGRRAAAQKKYTADPFEAAGIEIESSASGNEEIEEISDDEYTMDVDDGPPRRGRLRKANEVEDEDDEDEEEYEEEDEGEGSGEEEPLSVIGSDVEEAQTRKATSRPTGHTARLDPLGTHSRGLFKPSAHAAKAVNLKLTFGASDEDLLPLVYTRDRWTTALDTTFPSRDSLRLAFSMTDDEIGAQFGVSGELLRREATAGWDWYYDENIGGRLRKRQKMEIISEDYGQNYLPRTRTRKHTVLMGPAKSQKDFELGVGESLDFGEAWSERKQKGPAKKKGRPKKGGAGTHEMEIEEPIPADDEHVDGVDGASTMRPRRNREGWLLNLGNKIQCLSWATNCQETSQYLAVAVPITDLQKQPFNEGSSQGSPAFTPSPPYHSAIQIWSFESTKEGDDIRQLDMTVTPRLRKVICTDAGDVRRLAWCPMDRDNRDEDENDEEINLGLLGGVWGDGSVKILDVKVNKKADEAEYVHIQVPAFEARPPSTLCTCFCWLSPSDIAVGTANGFVGIWSLASPSNPIEPSANPMPYIYIPVHSTYILTIASSYPTHPHLLVTTAMEGKTQLFSLLDPQIDITEGSRSRLGSSELSYAPFLRSYITVDETEFVRLQPIRRFFSTVSAMQTYSSISAMTPSNLCHPSVLIGNVGGTAMASNPLRKLINPKEKHWQQTWFTHEWVPDKREGDEDRKAAMDSPGISKFYDGFKAEMPRLMRKLTGDKRIINGNLAVTIFEEGTAVTALAWNMNKECAGWACAGMGCGLLRVEDVAL